MELPYFGQFDDFACIYEQLAPEVIEFRCSIQSFQSKTH